MREGLELVSVNIDRKRIEELCNQIKTKLEEQGKNHLILTVAETNEFFDDTDIEDGKCFEELDCETRLVDYDCGGYDRDLRLDGVAIENGTLFFYLTEREESYKGCNDINTYKEDLDGFLNNRCWWMAGGNPVVEFEPERVLEFYLGVLLGNIEPVDWE